MGAGSEDNLPLLRQEGRTPVVVGDASRSDKGGTGLALTDG